MSDPELSFRAKDEVNGTSKVLPHLDMNSMNEIKCGMLRTCYSILFKTMAHILAHFLDLGDSSQKSKTNY